MWKLRYRICFLAEYMNEYFSNLRLQLNKLLVLLNIIKEPTSFSAIQYNLGFTVTVSLYIFIISSNPVLPCNGNLST